MKIRCANINTCLRYAEKPGWVFYISGCVCSKDLISVVTLVRFSLELALQRVWPGSETPASAQHLPSERGHVMWGRSIKLQSQKTWMNILPLPHFWPGASEPGSGIVTHFPCVGFRVISFYHKSWRGINQSCIIYSHIYQKMWTFSRKFLAFQRPVLCLSHTRLQPHPALHIIMTIF